jgi:hypothetical protein
MVCFVEGVLADAKKGIKNKSGYEMLKLSI